MLSTITPFGERSRGHRYAVTATWFVVGAVVGGLTLGVLSGLLAVAAATSGLTSHPAAVAAVGAALCLAAAAVDLGAFGPVLPVVRRQVDDGWLARYRPWFYAAGFGWQVGVGVATYVMTTGVLLLVGLSALTGSAWTGPVVGVTFGLVRGLTVFLTSRAVDPAGLRRLHARLDRLGPVVRGGVISAELAAAAALIMAVWPGPGLLAVAIALAAIAVLAANRAGHSSRASRTVGPN